MAEVEVEVELQTATNIAPNKNEERQAYLTRLTTAASELADEDFKKLSKSALAWVDASITAHNEDHPINDFPVVEQPDVKEETVTAPTKKKSKKAKAPAEAKPEAKPKKKVATPAEPKKKKVTAKPPTTNVQAGNGKDRSDKPARKVGAQTMIKRMVLKDPQISIDVVVERLEKAGFPISRMAASTIRTGFRHSLKVIQEEGLLKSIKL